MGIVDEDRRAVALADELEATLGAFEMRERGEGREWLPAGRDDEARGEQRVLDLKSAGQRQTDAVIATAVLDCERLREAINLALDQENALATPADGDEPQGAPFCCRGDESGVLVIGRDHGRAAGLDQIGEQAQLGGEISLQRRVIIEMVAAEIGEAAGRHAHAVEAALIESMRGRFDGEMRHAFTHELIKRAMQRDGIRRRERAIDFALRRYEPDRTDAGGGMAEYGPDLAGERGDRRLAARAGDRGDYLWLPRIEF